MAVFLVTLRLPENPDDPRRNRRNYQAATEQVQIDATDVVYEGTATNLIAVKFVDTEGATVAVFPGASFVSAVRADAAVFPNQTPEPVPAPVVDPVIPDGTPQAKRNKDK